MSIKALAATYRAEVSEALADDQIAEIRAHLQQQNVLGTDRLRDWVT